MVESFSTYGHSFLSSPIPQIWSVMAFNRAILITLWSHTFRRNYLQTTESSHECCMLQWWSWGPIDIGTGRNFSLSLYKLAVTLTEVRYCAGWNPCCWYYVIDDTIYPIDMNVSRLWQSASQSSLYYRSDNSSQNEWVDSPSWHKLPQRTWFLWWSSIKR